MAIKKTVTKKMQVGGAANVSKKPVTVVNAKGKTVDDPNKMTRTTYNKKGKTLHDPNKMTRTFYNKKGKTVDHYDPASKNFGTTVYNKKGVTQKLEPTGAFGGATVIKNKKGTEIYDRVNDRTETYNKKGKTVNFSDGSVTTTNSKGITTTPPKKTTTASNNTSIEQKAKDVMSGKYGNGAARKQALGADYDKVQAIINKQMAGSKAAIPKAKYGMSMTKMKKK